MHLEEKIKSIIKSSKRDMRLDVFLELLLYDKNGYYYQQKPIGKRADFITAPEISQIFGEIIGIYLYYYWAKKINKKFNFIELGPGNGTLFNDITNCLVKFPQFFEKAKVTFVEVNKELKRIQKTKIRNKYLSKISWNEKINFKSKKPSIIYSNEFFDCFPVRQFFLKKIWKEKYVNYDENLKKFFFKDKKVNSKKLLSLLKNFNEQKILEISLKRNSYFEKICKYIKLNGGIFLTIDYGYFDSNENFTLQAIQNHKFSHIFEDLGQKDVSSHVNFNDFLDIAKKNKLKIQEYCTQREFLIKYGILERAKKISELFKSEDIVTQLDKLISNKEMGKLFKCIVVSNL